MRSLVLFLTLCLSSCSGPIYVLLYNNTVSSIQVSTLDTVVTIASKTQETFKLAPGSPVRLRTDKDELVCPFRAVPGEYYETYSWPWYRVHLQLEPDHSIVAVKPKQTMPSDAVDQPEGYPLVARKTAL